MDPLFPISTSLGTVSSICSSRVILRAALACTIVRDALNGICAIRADPAPIYVWLLFKQSHGCSLASAGAAVLAKLPAKLRQRRIVGVPNVLEQILLQDTDDPLAYDLLIRKSRGSLSTRNMPQECTIALAHALATTSNRQSPAIVSAVIWAIAPVLIGEEWSLMSTMKQTAVVTRYQRRGSCRRRNDG